MGCPQAATTWSNMANDLKMLLESSLNEIFKATVSDILESVDRTLSEYQGKIRRIESENEGLRRLLFAGKSKESAVRGMEVTLWWSVFRFKMTVLISDFKRLHINSDFSCCQHEQNTYITCL